MLLRDANVDVGEYDPAQGPPELPEEEESTNAADQNDQNQTNGNDQNQTNGNDQGQQQQGQTQG